MRFKVPVARFSELSRRAMQFRHRGRDVLPAYSYGSFIITKGKLRITVVSPAQATRVSCDAEGDDGELTMKLDLIDKIVSFLPDKGDLTITAVGGQATFTVGGVRMHVPVNPDGTTIDMPTPPKDGWQEIASSTLLDMIQRVNWAQDNDSRPQLAGVHFTGERVEATNTHVIARSGPGIDFGQPVMIPNVRLVAPFLYDGGDVKVALDGNWVWLRTKSWATCLRRFDSTWPTTDQLIMAKDATEHLGLPVRSIFVNRQEMLKACQRISGTAVSDEEKKAGAAVLFDLREDGLHMVSHYPIETLAQTIVVDEIVEWAEDTVTEQDLKPFDGLRNMAIYGLYLRKALEAMRGKVVRMCWCDDFTKSLSQWQDTESQLRVVIAPRRVGPVS